MIINFLIAQIITDWVRITKNINVPVFPEIHRHIRLLQLSEQFRIFYTGEHIENNVPPVFMIFLKFRKKNILFFIKHIYRFKQAAPFSTRL